MSADGIYAHVSKNAEVRTKDFQVVLPWPVIGNDELHCSEQVPYVHAGGSLIYRSSWN
jgi:hypothetical protein